MRNPLEARTCRMCARRAATAIAALVALGLGLVTAPSAKAQSLTTLHSFQYSDGDGPWAGLVQGGDGNFYGTTPLGGANSCFGGAGCGTIFKVTPGGALTTLHTFCSQSGCTDGYWPYGGLVQGSDGNFYGTTEYGGASGGAGCQNPGGTVFKITPGGASGGAGCQNPGGTVFKITPSGALTPLYSFCSLSNCADGAAPFAALVQGSDGNFYGTTAGGGTNGGGTVFAITPGGALTTLYSFCSQSGCTDGYYPYAGLVQGSDGNFYGTTNSGGGNGKYGTVFKITPGGGLNTLHRFCSQSGCSDGAGPGRVWRRGATGTSTGRRTWAGPTSTTARFSRSPLTAG